MPGPGVSVKLGDDAIAIFGLQIAEAVDPDGKRKSPIIGINQMVSAVFGENPANLYWSRDKYSHHTAFRTFIGADTKNPNQYQYPRDERRPSGRVK